MMQEKANCQEGKGEHPLKHKVSFEWEGAWGECKASLWKSISLSRTSMVKKKSQGQRCTKCHVLCGTCQITYKILSTVLGLTQIIKGKNNLTLLFPFILYVSWHALLRVAGACVRGKGFPNLSLFGLSATMLTMVADCWDQPTVSTEFSGLLSHCYIVNTTTWRQTYMGVNRPRAPSGGKRELLCTFYANK